MWEWIVGICIHISKKRWGIPLWKRGVYFTIHIYCALTWIKGNLKAFRMIEDVKFATGISLGLVLRTQIIKVSYLVP